MKKTSDIKVALHGKSLTNLTKVLAEVAEELAYQLKPPYTEVKRYKASEEADNFAIDFSASLYLHYFSLTTNSEGLVFVVDFRGNAIAESPSPPIHELFYAARVERLRIYGYGGRWRGRTIPTNESIARNLEVSSNALDQMELSDFQAALSQPS